MKYSVHVSMTLDDIEAEDEMEARIIAAQMFDFGSANFDIYREDDIVYLDDVADEADGDVYAEDIEDEIRDLTMSH